MFAIKLLPKRIALLSLAAACLSVLAISQIYSQEKGVTLSNGRATLKQGFQFHRVSDKQVEVRRFTAGTTEPVATASVTCSCTKAPPEARSAFCSVQLLANNTAVCGKKDGCTECKMDIK